MKTTKYLLIMVFGIFLFAGGFVLLRLVTEPQGVMQTLPFILIGIGCGAFGYGLAKVVQYFALRNHPEMAKQFEIELKDERNSAIENLAKAKAFDVALPVFAILILSFALMGAKVSIIIPLVAGYLFICSYRIYWYFRLTKRM